MPRIIYMDTTSTEHNPSQAGVCRRRETPAQRKRRLAIERERSAKRRQAETIYEREQRRRDSRIRGMLRRTNETDEQREHRRAMNRNRMAEKRRLQKELNYLQTYGEVLYNESNDGAHIKNTIEEYDLLQQQQLQQQLLQEQHQPQTTEALAYETQYQYVMQQQQQNQPQPADALAYEAPHQYVMQQQQQHQPQSAKVISYETQHQYGMQQFMTSAPHSRQEYNGTFATSQYGMDVADFGVSTLTSEVAPSILFGHASMRLNQGAGTLPAIQMLNQSPNPESSIPSFKTLTQEYIPSFLQFTQAPALADHSVLGEPYAIQYSNMHSNPMTPINTENYQTPPLFQEINAGHSSGTPMLPSNELPMEQQMLPSYYQQASFNNPNFYSYTP